MKGLFRALAYVSRAHTLSLNTMTCKAGSTRRGSHVTASARKRADDQYDMFQSQKPAIQIQDGQVKLICIVRHVPTKSSSPCLRASARAS
jgi:hypothetical protein